MHGLPKVILYYAYVSNDLRRIALTRVAAITPRTKPGGLESLRRRSSDGPHGGRSSIRVTSRRTVASKGGWGGTQLLR